MWCPSRMPETERPCKRPRLGAGCLVVCGPSGVGKGTLIAELQRRLPGAFGFAVSHTTRQPREGEVDGREYHFVAREHMLELVEAGEFLEHAHVHSNIYGTSRKAVRKVLGDGKICILDIDVQGCCTLRDNDALPGAKFLFIQPPSKEELETRLRGRGTETEDKIQLRLKNATAELEAASRPNLFDKVVVNKDVGQCATDVEMVLSDWFEATSTSTAKTHDTVADESPLLPVAVSA